MDISPEIQQLGALFSPRVTLRHVTELPVLGVPVRFETADADLTASIDTEYGHWESVRSRPELLSSARARVRLIVREDPHTLWTGAPDALKSGLLDSEHLLVVAEGVLGFADAKARTAVAYISSVVAGDRERLRSWVLDPLTLFAITRADRQPVHAAALKRGDNALLLAGPSGSGKSTLAYAASRGGYEVLADDAVYVQMQPKFRIWALGGRMHLSPESVAQFPELVKHTPIALPSGKSKIAIARPRTARKLPVAERAGICILARSRVKRDPEQLTPEQVLAELATTSDPGFDRFAATLPAILQRLAQTGAWKLFVVGRPAALLPSIDEMLEAIARVK